MFNEKVTSRRTSIIIILLLSLVLSLSFLVGFFILKNQETWDITKAFKANEEHTLLLDEFIVNLKSERPVKNYLKIQIALMYGDGKGREVLENNTNKIRDIISNQLRSKTSEEMLDTERTSKLKEEIINDINAAIKQGIIEDIYFTDLVIQ